MSINAKVEQWFNEMKAEYGLSDYYVLDEGELLNWLAKRKPKLKQCSVSGSLPIAVASIRSNFELWRKGEINDGAFSWHLKNNLLRIEKELGWSCKGNDR